MGFPVSIHGTSGFKKYHRKWHAQAETRILKNPFLWQNIWQSAVWFSAIYFWLSQLFYFSFVSVSWRSSFRSWLSAPFSVYSRLLISNETRFSLPKHPKNIRKIEHLVPIIYIIWYIIYVLGYTIIYINWSLNERTPFGLK